MTELSPAEAVQAAAALAHRASAGLAAASTGQTDAAILGHYGFNISKMGLTGMIIGNTIYPLLTVTDAINLTIMAFVVTLLAGLYPAILAARMEPVDALRAEK